MHRPVSRLLVTTLLLLLSVGLYAAHARFQPPSAQDEPAPGIQRPSDAAETAADRLRQEMTRLEKRLTSHPGDYEASLLKGLLYFKSGKLDDALAELGALTHRAPKFQLAHLIQGDLLLAQARPVTDLGQNPLARSLGDRERLEQLREEARVRLQAYLHSLQDRLMPRHLLSLGESVQTALVVDKRTHRLFVYRPEGDGKSLKLVRDFYVSTGKLMGNKTLRGDLRTPEGVYFVTSHIPDSRLPDKYGIGAFPMNYPNEFDQRLGKTGGGIWLHGTARDYYSRPPLDSEGCVVLTNVDLGLVGQYISPGSTPVVIADGVEWVEPAAWRTEREGVLAALEQWRRDWESGDVEAYLSHYAADFWADGYDRERWSERKRRVAQGKTYQQVQLHDVALLAYPHSATGGRDVVVVNFRQDYRSNNFSSEMGKRIYLAQEEGRWRILYEGGQ